ncbi:MAG: phenylalanine--tRNA ligase subunit alpha [Oscillospiraceae bacterium]|nr:phenylalanine--tRNA ligase subunit alpha [Oscillospiraceae bacterium]
MKEQLTALKHEALAAIAGAEDLQSLEALRVRFLGKKGELTAILKQMGGLSAEERPVIGQMANALSEKLTGAIAARREALEAVALDAQLVREKLDITIPGTREAVGKQHVMRKTLDEALDIFIGLGFSIAEGPEVELAVNVFDKLNTPDAHPSRDWSDTFYFDRDSEYVLRTQTSPVQVRVMENQKPPIRVVSPGRVYRKDEVDATHSPMFHQIEGLVVDKGITMADLKGTLNALVEQLYGVGTATRFRPHHFPFTEPSCEVDCQCFKCRGKGCPMCKGEGWIELLGAGMVHPNVLRNCGIDPEVYTGFAFGIGLDRMTMMRYNISDLRLIFENDLRFLRQF